MADPQSYPGTQIAKLLNLTERRLQQLAKEGVIPKSERGRYPLVGAVRGYIEYLQARAIGNDAAPTDLHAERARLTKAQADKTELEVAELRGELISTPKAISQVEALVAATRAKLIGLPTKIAPRVANTPAELARVQDLLRVGIYEALAEMSSDQFQDELRRRIDRGNGSAAVFAAAEPDGKPVGRRKPKAKPGKQRRARPVAD